ncbi:MAG: type II toxin-antitoxin system RelE/ParE family toxin [Pasteurella sp.]|nr:type II toxin-antitoxin system RelE/ParE family toxin [Pasteurella sp.]
MVSTAGIIVSHKNKLNRILTVLENATDIQEINLPSYDLHKLSGSLQEHWSVKVNGNWRVTFKFENGDAEIVNYQDYH